MPNYELRMMNDPSKWQAGQASQGDMQPNIDTAEI
jgi:hypothetical protein